MIGAHLEGKAVIVTGGTAGIGLATGRAFAGRGAHVYLTHRWGSQSEDAIRSMFAADGVPAPTIVEADAAADEDTDALLDRVGQAHEHVEVLVSNVSFAQVSQRHADLTRKGFARSIGYSAWPFVSYLQRIHRRFGRYPRYVIGMSSRGPDCFLPGYDFVAAAKTVMEVMCRQLTVELGDADVRMNIIRANPVDTESLRATFGPDFVPFCRRYHGDDFFIREEEVGSAALALCSGLMDAVRGQVLVLDRGLSFADNVVRLFEHREHYGLALPPEARAQGAPKETT
ncbi:MAG: SDR family oxidoreductase [Myxococcales bacterium FL481]|nr:MAG: SDR family oxidoreductase [Myxococcales bacterium FL481]